MTPARDLGVERTARHPAPSEALQRLRRGELSLEAYLDHRADESVRHLDGLVSNERLAFIREMIREQLTSDPVLVELVRRATGHDPLLAAPK